MQNPIVKKAIALAYCPTWNVNISSWMLANTMQKKRNYSYTGKRTINYTTIVNKHNILATVVCGVSAIKVNYCYYKTWKYLIPRQSWYRKQPGTITTNVFLGRWLLIISLAFRYKSVVGQLCDMQYLFCDSNDENKTKWSCFKQNFTSYNTYFNIFLEPVDYILYPLEV